MCLFVCVCVCVRVPILVFTRLVSCNVKHNTCNLYMKPFSQHTFICLVTIPGWYSYQTNKGVLIEWFYV